MLKLKDSDFAYFCLFGTLEWNHNVITCKKYKNEEFTPLFQLSEEKRIKLKSFLLSTVTDLVQYTSDDYPDRIFLKKDDDVLYEYDQKNERLWYYYDKIYVIFKSYFNMYVLSLCDKVIHG